jgi:hypothetical protein
MQMAKLSDGNVAVLYVVDIDRILSDVRDTIANEVGEALDRSICEAMSCAMAITESPGPKPMKKIKTFDH